MLKQIPTSTLRNHLADVLKDVEQKSKFMLITKKDRPVSVLVNIDFFEDLLAGLSPAYIKSIQDAREDYKKGRVFTHQEVFGKL